MDPLTAIAIITALARFAPQIPSIVQGIETAINLLRDGRAPTPEEQAQIDAALEEAHKQLQSA